ncbi:sensor histidine kinase [Streptomyces sp. URMC 123]|uniref:sensor histidine kinase n=1 Tax=Streptomyces sp. URMC 123 TaxID=3423403 RepID=UPI003F1BE236
MALIVASFPIWPGPVRGAAFLITQVALVTVVGLSTRIRGASVRLANRLLRTGLPAPVAAPGSSWPNRWRTAGWLVLHTTVGSAVTASASLLLMVVFGLPLIWAEGGDDVVLLFLVEVPAGRDGLWTVPVALVLFVMTGFVGAGSSLSFRLLAPALLGHRPAEQLAALEGRMHALEQRDRLARELHDSIGHTLTAATIQAAVAQELLTSDPDSARRALSSIEHTSRMAMEDLDHVLGVLREGIALGGGDGGDGGAGHGGSVGSRGDLGAGGREGAGAGGREGPGPSKGAAGPGSAATAPARSLHDLSTLVEGVRQTGTEVRTLITGLDDGGVRLPATVSREAYRILQEGLTNAMRHAAGAPITLSVTAVPGLLEVNLDHPLTTGPGDAGADGPLGMHRAPGGLIPDTRGAGGDRGPGARRAGGGPCGGRGPPSAASPRRSPYDKRPPLLTTERRMPARSRAWMLVRAIPREGEERALPTESSERRPSHGGGPRALSGGFSGEGVGVKAVGRSARACVREDRGLSLSAHPRTAAAGRRSPRPAVPRGRLPWNRSGGP